MLVAICLAVTAAVAHGQTWPTGPVTMVVPYAAGGNTDIMARLLADGLGRSLGRPVIVDNRGGAGGAIGADYVARAAQDGNTLLFGTTAQISVVPLIEKVRYDPRGAFAPISIYGENADILAVNADLPVSTVPELIAYAKAHPGEVNYGSGGVGSISHLAAALFGETAGVSLQHVPFRGGSQTVTELMAGHIQMYLGNTSEILPQASSPRLKMLAVSSAKRLQQVPDLPTIGETLPGYVVDTWNGLLAPAGVPPAVLARLETDTMKSAKDPEIVAKLAKLGIVARGSSAAEFRDVIASELRIYKDAVATAGLATP